MLKIFLSTILLFFHFGCTHEIANHQSQNLVEVERGRTLCEVIRLKLPQLEPIFRDEIIIACPSFLPSTVLDRASNQSFEGLGEIPVIRSTSPLTTNDPMSNSLVLAFSTRSKQYPNRVAKVESRYQPSPIRLRSSSGLISFTTPHPMIGTKVETYYLEQNYAPKNFGFTPTSSRHRLQFFSIEILSKKIYMTTRHLESQDDTFSKYSILRWHIQDAKDPSFTITTSFIHVRWNKTMISPEELESYVIGQEEALYTRQAS